MTATDHHLFRQDRAEHWGRISRVLRHEPQAMSWAMANIDRWLARGRLHPGPLQQWRQLLEAAQEGPTGLDALMDFIEETSVEAEQLRSCSPFVGGPFVSTITGPLTPILA
jgi:hypothetical protein